MNETRVFTPVLVIGSGISGCVTALTLAEQGYEVTLLTSGPGMDSGNSPLAQGGIVYQSEDHDPKLLEKDIVQAGWRHNYMRAVRFIARKGPQAVSEVLIDRLKIPFAQTPSYEWDLRLEGGHQANRILYCADFTGRAIMDGLMKAVDESPQIHVLTRRTAVDLLTSHHHARTMEYKYQLTNQCVGAYVLNQTTNAVETILADMTVLATGGIGQIYLHTTNSASSIGSGLAMAYRAGARVMNSEFVQFHPTALFHRAERRFLISEAMRGEGAKLINGSDEPFMTRYDPRGDLAPRDIVTRAILEEMLRTGEDYVYLDAASYVEDTEALKGHFPTIFEKCLEMGVDIRRDPIPVVPAAHYFIGGVLSDIHGRTTLERLYAVGECSCTGVHGANRLASTSLLECLLWGHSAGKDIGARLSSRSNLSLKLRESIPDWESQGEIHNEDPALIAQDWAAIRHTMWNYVGITRNRQRLARAVDDLRALYAHLSDFYKKTPLSKPIVDLFHGSHAAYIITMAAMRNKKSLGCHYRTD